MEENVFCMVIETICRNFTGYVSLARLGTAARTGSITTKTKKEEGFESISKTFFAPHGNKVLTEVSDELFKCTNDASFQKKRNQLLKANLEEIDSICQPCDGYPET